MDSLDSGGNPKSHCYAGGCFCVREELPPLMFRVKFPGPWQVLGPRPLSLAFGRVNSPN
jgi:hypothetical protein